MTSTTSDWQQSLKNFLKPSVITMLFLGFSAGIPILLIFSSLSLWLREAGVERSAVTFFSWAALGYSFKFVWAPLVDRLPLPFLTQKMGRRRSWLLFSQLAIMVAILGMAFTDPSAGPASHTWMALAAILLGFSSATQDICIDAYRIESDTPDMQALLSSTYIAGYRIGMVVAGAGALFLAGGFGSTMGNYSYSAWMWTYVIMAGTMLIGVVTTFVIPEPISASKPNEESSSKDHARFFLLFLLISAVFVSVFFFSADIAKELKASLTPATGKALAGFFTELVRLTLGCGFAGVAAWGLLKVRVADPKLVKQAYAEPIKDFFARYGTSAAILLLALVGLYRISDIVLGVISNVFYQDLGFSKAQIASVVKTFGLFMTILGGFLGGLLTVRYGVIKMLFLGAVLSAATNLLFMALASMGDHLPMLYLVISADNLAAGLASAAFIAFLSSLTNISFTAVQYAIFSSLMTLFPKIIGGYSGSMVDSVGYPMFFAGTAIMGLPVLLLVWLAGRRLETTEKPVESPAN